MFPYQNCLIFYSTTTRCSEQIRKFRSLVDLFELATRALKVHRTVFIGVIFLEKNPYSSFGLNDKCTECGLGSDGE